MWLICRNRNYSFNFTLGGIGVRNGINSDKLNGAY